MPIRSRLLCRLKPVGCLLHSWIPLRVRRAPSVGLRCSRSCSTGRLGTALASRTARSHAGAAHGLNDHWRPGGHHIAHMPGITPSPEPRARGRHEPRAQALHTAAPLLSRPALPARPTQVAPVAEVLERGSISRPWTPKDIRVRGRLAPDERGCADPRTAVRSGPWRGLAHV